MSAQQDIIIWEFLDSGNFHSTENLNKLSAVLLDHKDVLMNAYGWEYEEWSDGLPDSEEDGEDAYFRAQDQEEIEFEAELLNI
jgi:hypothetical protein